MRRQFAQFLPDPIGYTRHLARSHTTIVATQQLQYKSKSQPWSNRAKCYYHNTAKLSHEGSWFFNNGYKRMWMEYSGIVKYGIDADKVTISPDANGHRVIITVPPAHVLDDPDVNEKSFSKPLVSTGFATSITAEEKTEMFDKAQQSMLKQAKTDSALLAQAEARARTILEQYVRNVLGDDAKNWTIEFKDVQ
ncbi:DUF4230 domain-containing protein [Bifidobacterium adolescentis]|uniref:DUF4230 domain-containing protein n=1 Tax=Bifidobacterium adolescentis TaxID=1680 RepID=UPI003BB5F97D